MRGRAILSAVTVAALATASPLGASPSRSQKVDGSIKVATPHPMYGDGCLGLGAQYQLATLEQPALSGYVGYQFEVERGTWGEDFKLVAGEAGADFDLAFFRFVHPGFVTEEYVFYATRSRAEKGVVPPGATKALVCLYDGSDAPFRYRAGP
ncbi:MAG TPA: hypothetical protein VEU29_02960 [Actinomycetota bacterium]|nr:hypothetical protein [Actinomycetota bacterium]